MAEERLAKDVKSKEKQRKKAEGELEQTRQVLTSLQRVDMPMWQDRANEATRRLEQQQKDLAVQNKRISKLVSTMNSHDLSGAERDSLESNMKVPFRKKGYSLKDVIAQVETSLVGQRALAVTDDLPPKPDDR